jgi:hypothetical protein
MCGLVPQWEAHYPASRLLNGKRLIALSGVRDAAAATPVVLLCWQLDQPTSMKVTMDILARGGLHGGWGGIRSSLQAQLRETTPDCVGHSVLFPDTSSSMGLLSRASDLPCSIRSAIRAGHSGCSFCAGLHAMQAQTASDHPDCRQAEGSQQLPTTQRPKLNGGRHRRMFNSCASRTKETRMQAGRTHDQRRPTSPTGWFRVIYPDLAARRTNKCFHTCGHSRICAW